MKRNIFPLLGIAFVVAIAATGVFYGLFVGRISGATQPGATPGGAGIVVVSRPVDRGAVLTAADVRLERTGPKRPEGVYFSVEDVLGKTVAAPLSAREPVTAAALAGARASGGLPIPSGMRAISIRVADSTGLLPFVRSGQRIDVVAIFAQAASGPAVRTLLSDVEVLSVHADAAAAPQAANTVINLLVPARDVERVALADSTAKVRIVLRNGGDREEPPVPARLVADSRRSVSAPAPAVPRVTFQVRMAAASAETVRELSARTETSRPDDNPLLIGVLPKSWQAGPALRLLSTESGDSPQSQEISFQAGGAAANNYGLRLGLTARGAANGLLRLRVRPELTLPQRGGVSSRRFSADLDVGEGQSVLLAGFERDVSAPSLIEKLFCSPVPHDPGSELLLVVTPNLMASVAGPGK